MHFHSSAEEILHKFLFQRETKGKASENMKWLHNKSLYQQSHCKNPTQNQHSILATWICLWKWVLAHFSSTAAISFETPAKSSCDFSQPVPSTNALLKKHAKNAKQDLNVARSWKRHELGKQRRRQKGTDMQRKVRLLKNRDLGN